MATNLSKPKYLEFYGLPGCGKSTISHTLAKQLKDNGFKIYEPSYSIDHNKSALVRKWMKVFFSIKLMFTHPYIFFNLLLIVYNLTAKRNIFLSNFVNLSYKIYIYKSLRHEDYICFDEGLIQSVISMGSDEIDIERTLKKIIIVSDIANKFVVPIYVYCSINNALTRLHSRHKHDSSVEKIKSIELRTNYLKKKRLKCDHFSQKKSIIINGNDVLEEILYDLSAKITRWENENKI